MSQAQSQLFSTRLRPHPSSSHLCLLPQCPPRAVHFSSTRGVPASSSLPGEFLLTLYGQAPLPPPPFASLLLEAFRDFACWTLCEPSTLFVDGYIVF